MRNWIRFPRVEGVAPRQAHCDLPPDTYERELGREGFFGPASHMLHKHPPTGWIDWEGPLRPRALDLTRLEDSNNSPWLAREILHNANVRLRQWRTAEDMDHLVRNSDGDELLFVHQGAGELFCDYGHMSFREGDYIVIPRGTLWRITCREPITLLLIEATDSAYQLPDKGLVGQHAIFDPALLETPHIDDSFRAQQTEDTWRVVVKRRGQYSTITFPYNPLDAVGWQGDLVPVKINWRDIRPLMSHRYHLPPSAHTTFVAQGFVICTFVPRPIESDPGALKVPFFHNNDDYDEIIFYHQGEFFSRDNIHPGMLTLHPCGFAHGPHPKALQTGAKAARKETDEVAVMIDTRYPVIVNELPDAVENRAYVDSWKSPGVK
ncbi:homogentisate 1,2-dioxygenase [Mangrovitalea sediminis]|uniref:homogentisate 1,2-dioxygenase n=1 Tax=Mangrovitalea sediminis TaxID=1982043 RepID=UPI000BE60A1A|nr:homogentisate 1,2-dioxygenase [Mangrovitalea sediminis]